MKAEPPKSGPAFQRRARYGAGTGNVAMKMSSSGPADDELRVSDQIGYTMFEPAAVDAAMLE